MPAGAERDGEDEADGNGNGNGDGEAAAEADPDADADGDAEADADAEDEAEELGSSRPTPSLMTSREPEAPIEIQRARAITAAASTERTDQSMRMRPLWGIRVRRP